MTINKKQNMDELANSSPGRSAELRLGRYGRISKFASWTLWNMEYGMKKLTLGKHGSSRLSTFDFRLSTQRGFTLVETLVALSILLVAVVGPISLIGDALHRIYYAKDQIIAINLAQEGIEVVRQVRDSNMLGGVVAWDTGITITPTPNYVIDVGSGSALVSCISGCDQKVYLDGTTGLYRQNSTGTATQFSRVVTISDIGTTPVSEKKITSTVTWKTGGDTGILSVSENIFKWAI